MCAPPARFLLACSCWPTHWGRFHTQMRNPIPEGLRPAGPWWGWIPALPTNTPFAQTGVQTHPCPAVRRALEPGRTGETGPPVAGAILPGASGRCPAGSTRFLHQELWTASPPLWPPGCGPSCLCLVRVWLAGRGGQWRREWAPPWGCPTGGGSSGDELGKPRGASANCTRVLGASAGRLRGHALCPRPPRGEGHPAWRHRP